MAEATFDKAAYAALETSLRRAPSIIEALEEAKAVLQRVLDVALPTAEHVHAQVFVFPRLVDAVAKRGDLAGDAARSASDFCLLAIDCLLKFAGGTPSSAAFMWEEVLLALFTDTSPLYAKTERVGSDAYLYHKHQGQEAALAEALAANRAAREAKGARWACVPINIWEGSALLVRAMNHFARRGGFALLLAAASDPEVSFAALVRLLKPIVKARDYWVDTPMLEWIVPFFEPVRARLMATAFETLKAEDRAAVDDLRSQIDSLHRRGSVAKGVEAMQRFTRELALKLLASPSMPTRVQGAADVRDLVALVAKQDRHRRSPAAAGKMPAAFGTQPAELVSWIRAHGLLDVFFGPAAHMEIMRRGGELLAFLAGQGALSDEDLDLVWAAGQGKHEAVEKVVVNVLSELVAVLPLPRLDHLFSLIAATPLPLFTVDSVALVRLASQQGLNWASRAAARATGDGSDPDDAAEVAAAVAAAERGAEYGLPVLWLLIQDAAGVSDTIGVAALRALADTLSWQCEHPKRCEYMRRCVANIRGNSSMCASMMLLRTLLGNYQSAQQFGGGGAEGGEGETIERTIEWLAHECGLMDALLDNLGWYHDTAKAKGAALLAAGTVANREALDQAVLVGRQTHGAVYRERSLLLGQLLTSSRVGLAPPLVDKYWAAVITDPVTLAEQADGFLFLERTCSVADSFSDATVQYLFMEKARSLDIAALAPQSYAFYEYFFRYTNWREKRFEQKANLAMTVLAPELLGLDCIWRMCFEATDPRVFDSASAFMLQLYQSLAPALAPVIPAKREEYARTCLFSLSAAAEALRAGATGPALAATELRAERALALLRLFLRDFAASGPRARTPRPHGASDGGRPVALRITLEGGRDSGRLLSIEATGGMTLLALRTRVGKALTPPEAPYMVRIHREGTEITAACDGSSLEELGFAPLTTLGAGRAALDGEYLDLDALDDSEPDSETSDGGAPLCDAGTLLARSDYFEPLFGLLALPAALSAQVWALLMQIPTNSRRADVLLSLAQSDDPAPLLASLFNGASLYALSYNLQIMQAVVADLVALEYRAAMVAPEPADAAEPDAARLVVPAEMRAAGEAAGEWCRRFLAVGGLQRLVGLLMVMSEPGALAATVFSQRSLVGSLALGLLGFFTLALPHYETAASAVTAETMGGPGKAHLADAVPLEAAAARLLVLIEDAARNATAETAAQAAALVRHAMALVAGCCLADVLVFNVLYDHPAFAAWFRAALLDCPVPAVRAAVAEGLLHLCRGAVSEYHAGVLPRLPLAFVFELAVGLVSAAEAAPTAAAELYSVLAGLVRLAAGAAPGSPAAVAVPAAALDALFTTVVGMLLAHPIVEARGGAVTDAALVGLLDTATALVSCAPALMARVSEGLVRHVLSAGLFETPTMVAHGPLAAPLCKTRAARAAGFAFLAAVAAGSATWHALLVDALMPHHGAHETDGSWSYVPAALEKGSAGYAGLENLGATCYMNSLMQQLFMIPKLRFGILGVPVPDGAAAPLTPTAAAAAVTGAGAPPPGPETMLFQLQSLFGNLQESERRYCATQPFCLSYRDSAGAPMNPRIQMDVDEFYLNLVDRLEGALRPTPRAHVLREVFGGVVTNEVICRQGQHVSERQETAYALSLTIQFKKTLAEALDLYVQGDMLEGDNRYNCAVCDTKVDALRRTCIKALPNTLLLHLKRFEFDYETLRRMKVDEAFEFPMAVDLRPWTQEGLQLAEALERAAAEGASLDAVHAAAAASFKPAGYYQYELSGVIVHSGTAEAGHYYSYIKDRCSGAWSCFNDSSVEPFDPAHIPGCCFGGQEMASVWDPALRRSVPRMQAKSYSAYMLLYTRTEQYPACSPLADPPAEPVPGAPAPVYPGSAEARVPLPVSPVPSADAAAALVPSPIYAATWAANERLLRDQHVFDEAYFGFLADVVAVPAAAPLARRAFELGARFVFETLLKAQAKGSLATWVDRLSAMATTDPGAARWLLDETLAPQCGWLMGSLFECTVPEARAEAARLLAHAFAVVAQAERGTLLDCDAAVPPEADPRQAPPPPAEAAALATPTAADLADGEGLAETAAWATVAAGTAPIAGAARLRALDVSGDLALAPTLPGRPVALCARWLDHVLGFLGCASLFWRSFGEYFSVIAAIARLGPLERDLLAARAVPARLMSFVLEEQSPYFPPAPPTADGSPPRAYRPMGDKSKSPDLSHCLAALSILLRGCTLDPAAPRPPSAVAGPLRELCATERNLLLESPLLARVFTNGMPTGPLAAALAHLAWGNAASSGAVVQALLTVVETAPLEALDGAFACIVPLVEAPADPVAPERTARLVDALLAELLAKKAVRAEAAALTLRLAGLAAASDAVRVWLLDAKARWMVPLLVEAPAEMVREEGERLVCALVPALHHAYQEGLRQRAALTQTLMASQADGALDQLNELDAAPVVVLNNSALSEVARVQIAELASFMSTSLRDLVRCLPPRGVAPKAAGGGTGALVVWLRLLRSLTTYTHETKVAFGAHFPALWALFLAIDQLRLDLDRSKKALMELWVATFDGVPENIARWHGARELPKMTVLLLNFYIIVQAESWYLDYNRPALATWFRLVWLLAEDSRMVRDVIAKHLNWEWMLLSIALAGPEYPVASELAMRVVRLQARDSDDFRAAWLANGLAKGLYDVSALSLLRLFDAVVVGEAGIRAFAEGGGLHSLLAWLPTYDRLSTDEPPTAVLPLVLSLAMRVLTGGDSAAAAVCPGPAAAEAWLAGLTQTLEYAMGADRDGLFAVVLKLVDREPALLAAAMTIAVRESGALFESEAGGRHQTLWADYTDCRIALRPMPLYGYGRARSMWMLGLLKDVHMGDRAEAADIAAKHYDFMLALLARALKAAHAIPDAAAAVAAELDASLPAQAAALAAMLLVETMGLPQHEAVLDLVDKAWRAEANGLAAVMQAESRLDEYLLAVLYAEPSMLAEPAVRDACKRGLALCQTRSEATRDNPFSLLAQLVLERVDKLCQELGARDSDPDADGTVHALADALRALDVLVVAPALRENVAFPGGLLDQLGALLLDDEIVASLDGSHDGAWILAFAAANRAEGAQ